MEPQRGEPAHGAFAAQDGAGENLVLGLVELVLGDAAGHHGTVDLGDPAEVRLGLAWLAAQEREERAGLVVILVGQLGAVGEAGIDQGPVEPRAGMVAQDRRQKMGRVAVFGSPAAGRR